MRIINFLREEDGWINYALMGAGALASFLSGRRDKKVNTTQTEDSTSTSTSSPQLAPEIQSARNKVLQTYLDRMGNNSGYLTAYTGNALRTVNRGSDLQQEALDSMLASRGLTGSVAGLAAKRQSLSDSFADKIGTLSQVPLLDRQLTSEDLQGLSGVIAQAPYGQTSTTTKKGTITGQQVTPGSNAEGAEQGIASAMSIGSLLKKYYPQGF